MNLRRKRMILMDGQWYGYLRTASGNPLTLQNAKRLRKLTICGNAVQDGTPSPDAPVEVQLCGDRTGNLFDKKHASNIDNWELSTSKDNGYYELQGIANGETITIALKLNSTLAVNSGIWFYTYDDVYKTGFNPQTTELQTTTMTYADGDYMRLYVPGTNGAVKNYMNLVDADLQIIRGSYTADTLPAYEPYGYKVSGEVRGVNLLDVSDSANILNGDTVVDGDSITFTTTDFCYGIRFARLTLDPNTEYTLSYQSVNFDGNYTDSYGLRAVIDGYGVPGGASSYITFTTNETGDVTLSYYVGIPYEGEAGKILTIKGVALYKGAYTTETMPPYAPYQPPQDFAVYLPEQIAKVGDVADEVVVDMESKTAELKKNVGSVVADGDERWMRGGNQYDNVDYTNRYSSFYDIHGNYQTPGYFSNRFERKLDDIWNNPNSEAFNINNNQLHLSISNTRLGITADDESADRTTKFKAWLNDNNVTVYAPLANPVTTDITFLQQWDAMPQVSGTVTLTLSAEVEPSGAEAVYYSKERGE